MHPAHRRWSRRTAIPDTGITRSARLSVSKLASLPGSSKDASIKPTHGVDVGRLEAASPAPDTPIAVASDYLPPLSQRTAVLLLNFLLNITFFIIVPTSASYANELGASTWFSGLTIGISTLIAGLCLLPFSRRYATTYRFPFLFSAACFVIGEIVYALAGVADTAWLMFLGRVILGAGFVSWMYVKKYMTDAIVVGTSKRTMMSACLVTTQVGGMAVGPFIGGLLSKQVRPMTDEHRLWNGFTASGWIMAGVWLSFFALLWTVFRDPLPPHSDALELSRRTGVKTADSSTTTTTTTTPTLRMMMRELDTTQKFSMFTMCWFSMVNFLVLGAWESNLPVFGHIRFGWSEYNSGNVIALGGVATLPLLFALVFVAKYVQDRLILAAGLLFGLLGLSLHMGSLESPAKSAVGLLASSSPINFASLFTSWFFVALGYNMLTTITISLLSKQIPAKYNGLTSTVIQLSNYTGRITGALWGTTVYQVGQFGIVSLEMTVTLIGACLIGFMWRKMDVNKG